MLPRILYLHPSTYQRLVRLSNEAERDGAYRVAKRLQAVVLNSQGRTSGDLAAILRAPRSKVSEWLARYQAHGVEGLLVRRPALRKAGAVDVYATATARRHSRQWSGRLWFGYRGLDLAENWLGPGRGVRRPLSSRARTQAA